MNAPLRKASVVILVLFGLLFANLNWVQAAKGEEYRTHERNAFRLRDVEYGKQRGNIEVKAAGVSTEAVALSKAPTAGCATSVSTRSRTSTRT